MPSKVFCFPALILCISLTPDLYPNHNDRLRCILRTCLVRSTSQRNLLVIFSWEKIEHAFHPPFPFSTRLCPSPSFSQQTFTKHVLLGSDRGKVLLLDEEETFLEECLDIAIVTTVMLGKAVHVKCLVQCLVYSRLLVKGSSFYLHFINTITSLFFLLPSPLPIPPSLLPPSTNYFSCLLQYICFFICGYRIIAESKILNNSILNYFQNCINWLNTVSFSSMVTTPYFICSVAFDW